MSSKYKLLFCEQRFWVFNWFKTINYKWWYLCVQIQTVWAIVTKRIDFWAGRNVQDGCRKLSWLLVVWVLIIVYHGSFRFGFRYGFNFVKTKPQLRFLHQFSSFLSFTDALQQQTRRCMPQWHSLQAGMPSQVKLVQLFSTVFQHGSSEVLFRSGSVVWDVVFR